MLKSEQLRQLQDFILKCKRSDLERLLKATNLPRGGLKHDIQSRLISYLEKDSPTKLFHALNQLRNAQNNVAHTLEEPQHSSVRTTGTCNPLGGTDSLSSSSNMLCSGSSRSSCNPDSTIISPSDFSPRDSSHPSPASFVPPGHSLITLAGANHGCFHLPATIPGFRFRESPFFKQIDVLIQPQVMVPSNIPLATDRRSCDRVLILRFTSDQAETIFYHCHSKPDGPTDFGVQVVMRFARLSPDLCEKLSHRPLNAEPSQSTCEPIDQMEDSLPIHLSIVVNGHTVQLPALLPSSRSALDGRRNPRPINITQFLLVSPAMPNYIKLAWTHDYSACVYNLVAVYLMHKRSPQQLCSTLQTDAFRTAEQMKEELVRKLQPNSSSTTTCEAVTTASTTTASLNPCPNEDEDEDDLIICSTMPTQLLCPLSKCRITIPIRGNACSHVQCFDAATYLIMNEQKPAWNCPVCAKKAYYEDLFVDGLFLQVLNSPNSKDLEEIVFHADGSWGSLEKSTTTFSDAVDSDDGAVNDKSDFGDLGSSSPPHSTSFGSSHADIQTHSRETEPPGCSRLPLPSHRFAHSPLRPSSATRSDNQTRTVDPRSSSLPLGQGSSCEAITIDLTGSDDDRDETDSGFASANKEHGLVSGAKRSESNNPQSHPFRTDSTSTESQPPAPKHARRMVEQSPFPLHPNDRLDDRPRSHRVIDTFYSRHHNNPHRARPPNCPLSFGPPPDSTRYRFACRVGAFVPKDVGSHDYWHTFPATETPPSHPCCNSNTSAPSARYRQTDIQSFHNHHHDHHDLVMTNHGNSSWCDRRSRHVSAHLPHLPTARHHHGPRRGYHP